MSRWMKVALVALGLSVVPVSYALADAPAEPQKAGAEKNVRKGKGKDAEKHFPMDGKSFLQKVDARGVKAKERLGDKLDQKKVPADKQKAIMSDFDAGQAKVRAAAEQAAKDGTVTIEEAKTVRGVAKDARKDLRKEHGVGKGGKGAKKGKKDKGKKGKGTPA